MRVVFQVSLRTFGAVIAKIVVQHVRLYEMKTFDDMHIAVVWNAGGSLIRCRLEHDCGGVNHQRAGFPMPIE